MSISLPLKHSKHTNTVCGKLVWLLRSVSWKSQWLMCMQQSVSLKMCNILEESCSLKLKNCLLLQSKTLMEKPFWSDGLVVLNVLERPLEIVVKTEWITSWLWCATFINSHRTLATRCQSGGMMRWRLGMGALVWSINGKSSRDTNQYFQGQLKIPRASKLVV